MKTRIFENPVKFAQSVKVKVDGEYVSLLELLQNADIELDETPTSGSGKAVSSGGVFNALQEKQNQISITENDDGSVDINIPDAGEVSTDGVTVIDITSKDIFTDEHWGTLYLNLSQNGKYLIKNNLDDIAPIYFGYCKSLPNYGKFSSNFPFGSLGGATCGFEGDGAHINIYNHKIALVFVHDDYIEIFGENQF